MTEDRAGLYAGNSSGVGKFQSSKLEPKSTLTSWLMGFVVTSPDHYKGGDPLSRGDEIRFAAGRDNGLASPCISGPLGSTMILNYSLLRRPGYQILCATTTDGKGWFVGHVAPHESQYGSTTIRTSNS